MGFIFLGEDAREELYGLSFQLRPTNEGTGRETDGTPERGAGEQYRGSLEAGAKNIYHVVAGFAPRHLLRLMAGFCALGGTNFRVFLLRGYSVFADRCQVDDELLLPVEV